MSGKSRPMRKDEVAALETLLSYSDFYAEKEHWLEMGGPDRHIWNELKILLRYLQDVNPDTSLSEPDIPDGGPLAPVMASPYDNVPLSLKK
jgi:hypothetical protein